MITLRQIDAFRGVMVTGSVTGASKMLGVSQPAVTRLLQDLESELAFKLFVRASRQLTPTIEGRMLYEDVETAFLGLDQIKTAAINIKALSRGNIRLVTIPSIAGTFIGGIIAAFNRQYPDISISLEVQPSQRVPEYIASGVCDVGISTVSIDHSAIVSRSVLHGQSECIVPLGHRLSKKKKIVPKDLKNETFISYMPDSIYRHKVDAVFASSNVSRQLMLSARTTEAIFQMVASGLGVSIIGPSFPQMNFRPGIASIPFQPAIHGDLALLYLNHRPLSMVAERFVDMTETYIKSALSKRKPSGPSGRKSGR